MVGMVVTISPSLSLYRMVVLPAASRPTMRIRISFFANSLLNSFPKDSPIFFFQTLLRSLKTKHAILLISPSSIDKEEKIASYEEFSQISFVNSDQIKSTSS